MNANQLRRAFTQFFIDRGHTLVPSAGLIPHHQLAPLFTNAGMVQFLPYFLNEEKPPYDRATSVQRCVRIRGKHDDIEIVGRTTRHLTTFEMLGNFSFGDYFKEGAIKFHWELFTEVLGLDGDRLWITVHTSDDDAEAIWRDTVGIPPERIQRMGEDNFWEMGETGPCGPCSELYFDRGAEFGPDGGPLYGGDERFREIGNLVFMEFDRQTDKSLVPLAKQNIDTGSGLERILPTLQGVDSVFDIDSIRPIVATAESITGKIYGQDEETDVSLRIMADHARAMTLLTSDGVFPSNENRGYLLRRIVRRAVRHAYKIGGPALDAKRNVTSSLVASVVAVLGEAYPEIVKNKDFVADVLDREEQRFRQTISAGSVMFEQALREHGRIDGLTAFKLHDTFGFPIDLTREMAEEAGKPVDLEGFDEAMGQARELARANAKGIDDTGISSESYRKIVDAHGANEFVGYFDTACDTTVLAVLRNPDKPDRIEIFLQRTPFYAEQGGQVGDQGFITTETGSARVTDTTWALPGLVRHTAVMTDGRIEEGQEAHANIDVARRDAIRRNHTGTHILHWAMREVLGTHVKQAGSLVAPDRLRFDFSHFSAVTPEEIARIERLANEEILSNESVDVIETTKQEALDKGAIAFFGDKYGETVRMLQAGKHSLELCGGTHVTALGDIGLLKITSESSIGSNLRRIEAVTGLGSLDLIHHEEQLLVNAAAVLRTQPDELVETTQRALERQKMLESEIKVLRAQLRAHASNSLLEGAKNGAIVARIDDAAPNELRELALDLRGKPGITAVILIGSPDGSGVSLVAATEKSSGVNASELIAGAAKIVGGGGGKGADLAMAGGRHVDRIDEALESARDAVRSITPS